MCSFDEIDGKRELFSFDLDGTLTNGEYFWKQEPTPNLEMVKLLTKIYSAGNIVVIWTARQWDHAPETAAWLIKHSIPFHGLYMGKGGSDNYIDDKTRTFQELYERFK